MSTRRSWTASAAKHLGLFPQGFWRRHHRKIATGIALVLATALVGSIVAASFPVDDVDPERRKRGVSRSIAEDGWRRVDLRKGVHDPRIGTWIPTPSPPQETRPPHLYGGHATLLSAEFVPAMASGETYDFGLTVIGAGETLPDAFIAFAQRPTTDRGNAEDPSIVARNPVDFHATFFEVNKRRYESVRYTAQPSDDGRPLYLWLVSRGGDPTTAVGWAHHRGTVYPAFDSALGLARVRHGAMNALMSMSGVAAGAVIISPLLFQLWALLLLLVHRRRETLVRGVVPAAALFLAVSVPPLYELAAFSIISTEDWQGQRGPGIWRYFWTGGRGALWLLWGALAGAFLGIAAVRGERLRRRGVVVLVLAARLLVSLGFVAGALMANRNAYFAAVPLLAAAVDLAWIERLVRQRRREEPISILPSHLLAASAWLFGWAVTVVAQYTKALSAYDELPSEMPGGCFVVSAAAQGHRRIVRSRPGRDGRLENDQLIALRDFEHVLAMSHPKLHRPLRRVYNRLGPRLARRLDRPWKADMGYFALKPLEWMARLCLARRRSVACRRG